MPRIWSTFFVVAAVIAPLADAAACTCAFNSSTFPKEGASGVPRNTVIRLINATGAELVQGEQVIATTVEEVAIGQPRAYSVMRPSDLLAANTVYTLRGNFGSVTFSTGDQLDQQPPSAPRVVDDKWNETPWDPFSSCEPSKSRVIRLEGAVDADSPSVWFNVYGGATADSIDFSTPVGMMPHELEAFGNSGCIRSMSEAVASRALAFRAVDLAGNESEADVAAASCGCAASPSGSALIFAGVGGWIAFRRRRRRPLRGVRCQEKTGPAS